MKKSSLKDKIRSEFAAQTPDLLDSIQASCANTRQETAIEESDQPHKHMIPSPPMRRLAICAICLLLFISGISLGHLIPTKETTADPTATVYLDVNPSIEIQVDENDRVISCVAGNSDAESVLRDLELSGTDLNTAMTAVVGAMYLNGYLSAESNSILVSVDTDDDGKSDEMLNGLTDRINAVFEETDMTCSVIAQRIKAGEELKDRASEYGISVGKMYLVEKMIGGLESLDEADTSILSGLSIGELTLMYQNRSDGEADGLFSGDVVSGVIGGFLKTEEALSSLLADINIHSEILEEYEAVTEYEQIGDSWRMVYVVTIVLKGDLISYRYKIDCKTGEILERDLDFSFTIP
ncbi:MAG: hypothetical protein IJY39_11450 [Clostridia bacterium]|nr:hypothetical protein [Clostridia bacterium]